MRLPILVLLLSLFSTGAWAMGKSRPPRDILKSFENFQDAVTSHWEFECPDNPVLKETFPLIETDMKGLVEPILYDGLIRLQEMNPELAEFAAESVAGKSLTVTCKSAIDSQQDVIYKKRWILSDMMYMGQIAQFAPLNAGHYEMTEYIRKLNTPEYFETTKQIVSNFIFSSFLRFASVDEFGDRVVFNPDDDSLAILENDLVYACAAQAYPWGQVIYSHGSDRYTNTWRACMTCADAIRPGLTEAEKLQHSRRALDLCQNVMNPNYALPEAQTISRNPPKESKDSSAARPERAAAE